MNSSRDNFKKNELLIKNVFKIMVAENRASVFKLQQFIDEKYNPKYPKQTISIYKLSQVIEQLEVIYNCKIATKMNGVKALTFKNIKKADIRRIDNKRRRNESSYQLAFDIINQIGGDELSPAVFKNITEKIKSEFIISKRVVFQFEKAKNQQDILRVNNFLETIATAILNTEKLKIKSSKFCGEVTPLQIREYNSRWFLVGLKEGENDVFYTTINQISALKNTYKTVDKNEAVTKKILDKYFSNRIGLSLGTKNEFGDDFDPFKSYKVVLDVNKVYYHKYLKSKMWFDKFELKENEADSVNDERIIISSKINKELVSKLFSFKDYVVIKEPFFLRKHIKFKIETLLNKYQ